MIVVSDTSPLNYLILIDSIDVLPAIFGRVTAPSAAITELSHPRSPEAVRAWASNPPRWLAIQDPSHLDPSLKLGPGETAAISLAIEQGSDPHRRAQGPQSRPPARSYRDRDACRLRGSVPSRLDRL